MESPTDSVPAGEQREFDEVIHSPIRLQVCAILIGADSLRFAEVQAELAITDSHLSKNLRVLADAGYVDQSKHTERAGDRRRVVTVLTLTPQGQAAYRRHSAWLEHLTRGHSSS